MYIYVRLTVLYFTVLDICDLNLVDDYTINLVDYNKCTYDLLGSNSLVIGITKYVISTVTYHISSVL